MTPSTLGNVGSGDHEHLTRGTPRSFCVESQRGMSPIYPKRENIRVKSLVVALAMVAGIGSAAYAELTMQPNTCTDICLGGCDTEFGDSPGGYGLCLGSCISGCGIA